MSQHVAPVPFAILDTIYFSVLRTFWRWNTILDGIDQLAKIMNPIVNASQPGTAHDLTGVKTSSYIFRKALGSGASSNVWIAFDEKSNKDVAIKIYSPLIGIDSQIR